MFQDYRWMQGRPVGVGHGSNYLIHKDPYGRRTMVERIKPDWAVVYDSLELNFSRLCEKEQEGWRREWIQEMALVRDRGDFPLFLEKHESRVCQLCTLRGEVIAQQVCYYESLGDPWNGVILYDRQGKSILEKRYTIENGEFHHLIQVNSAPLSADHTLLWKPLGLDSTNETPLSHR